MKNKQGEKELPLLVYNTIESFPTATIPLSKQFFKLIMFLIWKENTTFEYNNYLQGIFPFFHNLGP